MFSFIYTQKNVVSMAHSLSLLLVEDSLPEQDLISEIFARATLGDFTIDIVVRLADVLPYLDIDKPDLILLDLCLPDSDGLDTLLAVLKSAQDIPVIVLSTNDDEKTGKEAIRLGAQDFLAKGNGAENLLPRISIYAIERHRARLKTEKAELFLRSTINALADHVAITDSKGNIIQTNTAWQSFAASLPKEKRAYYANGNYIENFLKLIGSKSDQCVDIRHKITKIMTGKMNSLEVEYVFPNTSPAIWFHLKITSFEAGASTYLVFDHHDISPRKEAEQAREKSRNLLRIVFDTTPNLVFVKDKEGKYVMVNRAMASTYGCTYQEVIGKTDMEIMSLKGKDKTEGQAFQSDDLQVIEKMQTKVIEAEPFTDPAGEISWYRTVKTPMSIPGSGTFLLGIAVNVTKDLENEAKIKESENLFRTLLNTLHLNIFLLDKNLQVIWANDRARTDGINNHKNIFGISCFELECGSGDCGNCPARTALFTGKIQTETIRDRTGKTIRMTGCPITTENGDVGKVVLINEDISERISLEKQLRQAQKMESLGTLAGGIAHDFNNILTAVLGFTELAILNTASNMKVGRDLKEIQAAGLRAKDLVHQILTFSRQVDQELRPLEMSLVVKEALKLLRATLPSSIRITSNVPSNLGHIIADPTQIHQVVMNLCTNAAYALKNQNGKIDITLSKLNLQENNWSLNQDLIPGPYLELRVQDTGTGISEEHLPFIFDPYFTTKDIGEGTGLGLAVIHGIVKDCGGDISVSSTPGVGTTFSIVFPEFLEEAIQQPDKILDQEIHGRGERILVVDDEPAILLLCKKLLEKNGYSVHTEKDPREALRYMNENPGSVDLMLSDIVMPYIQGDRLAEEIRLIDRHLPVILMSGNISNLPKSSKMTGKFMLTTKPIDSQNLLICIKKFLEKK